MSWLIFTLSILAGFLAMCLVYKTAFHNGRMKQFRHQQKLDQEKDDKKWEQERLDRQIESVASRTTHRIINDIEAKNRAHEQFLKEVEAGKFKTADEWRGKKRK
jgi:hypothetical protein